MALIQLHGVAAQIYQAWLRYFDESTPENRTHAFFAARRGEWPKEKG